MVDTDLFQSTNSRPLGRNFQSISKVLAWILAILLVIPALVPYFSHLFLALKPMMPTGFIQYDQLYYMSNAREHFDNGFSPTYGSPFSYNYKTSAIYFQPMSIFLGFIVHFTGADPALIFDIFGLVAAICCIRVSIALYDKLFGIQDWADFSGLLIFIWGGGLLVFSGLAYCLLTKTSDIFLFDPSGGWWFLNFGRNLVYPPEALYHLLFISSILLVISKRYPYALLVIALLSASHPFTGLQLLLILLAWSGFERFLLRNKTVPIYFVAVLVALLFIHLGYYMVFLNTFEEHRAVFNQWKLSWLLPAKSYIPAYVLVGTLVLLTVRRWELLRRVFEVEHNRLFLLWFLVSFALAKHDLLIKPIQPLHFTRGYIWTPLFLLGAPTLVAILRNLPRRFPKAGWPLVAGIIFLFLIDNAAWFGAFLVKRDVGFRVTSDERSLFTWLNRPENSRTVLLADPTLSYMATAYTPLRGWVTHDFNTPNRNQRLQEFKTFLESGTLPLASENITFLAVYDPAREKTKIPKPVGRTANWVYRGGNIWVMRILPAEPSPTRAR